MKTVQNPGVLVVERGHGLTNWSDRTPERSGIWRPPIPGEYRDIIRRYRGFEGTPWPVDVGSIGIEVTAGLAAVEDFDKVAKYYSRLKDGGVYDLIAIGPVDEIAPGWLPPGFEFCGLDYGHGMEDDYRCSLLYHEVIFGLEPELRAFAATLNDQLLLRSFSDVVALDEVRKGLLVRGAAIESTSDEDDPTGVVSIYGRPQREL